MSKLSLDEKCRVILSRILDVARSDTMYPLVSFRGDLDVNEWNFMVGFKDDHAHIQGRSFVDAVDKLYSLLGSGKWSYHKDVK